MKKLKKWVIRILIIGGLGYAVFMIFVNPSGFTSEQDVLTSFIANIDSKNACENHFTTETQSACEVFVTTLDGHTVSIDDMSSSALEMEVVLEIDGTTESFVVTFQKVPVTGLKRFLNSDYYYIDMIT